MVEIDRRKAALIAELAISRGEIRRSVRACEDSLDLVSRVRRNVRSNLKFWLPGAVLGGWVVSKLLTLRLGRSPRDPRPFETASARGRSAGWLISLLRVGFDLIRPTVLEMTTDWLTRKYSSATMPSGYASGAGSASAKPAEAERAYTRNGIV
jgi:hypothetical protein